MYVNKQVNDSVVYLINHLPPDKASEGNWSAINIEEEKSLMSMGLASLEILDEEDFMVRKSIRRSGDEFDFSLVKLYFKGVGWRDGYN